MDESVRRGQSVLGTAIDRFHRFETVLGTAINRISGLPPKLNTSLALARVLTGAITQTLILDARESTTQSLPSMKICGPWPAPNVSN